MKEFTKNDTACDMFTAQPNAKETNIGKVAILPLSMLSEDWQKPEYQLFRLKGGFGTSPLGRGASCFGHFCVDGQECRFYKDDFLGIGNEEVQSLGTQLESQWQSSNKKEPSEMS